MEAVNNGLGIHHRRWSIRNILEFVKDKSMTMSDAAFKRAVEREVDRVLRERGVVERRLDDRAAKKEIEDYLRGLQSQGVKAAAVTEVAVALDIPAMQVARIFRKLQEEGKIGEADDD